MSSVRTDRRLCEWPFAVSVARRTYVLIVGRITWSLQVGSIGWPPCRTVVRYWNLEWTDVSVNFNYRLVKNDWFRIYFKIGHNVQKPLNSLKSWWKRVKPKMQSIPNFYIFTKPWLKLEKKTLTDYTYLIFDLTDPSVQKNDMYFTVCCTEIRSWYKNEIVYKHQ